MSNLIPFNDIEQMGVVAAKSNLFGFKNPEEAMSLMILCQAEGMHPGIAMRDYHVIQGRPALKADAMLARFQQAGAASTGKPIPTQKSPASSLTRLAAPWNSPGHSLKPPRSA